MPRLCLPKRFPNLSKVGGLLILVLSLFSCTYTFSGLSSSQMRSVAIPVFENSTIRYGIEEVLTSKVVQAFIDDNRLKVVERERAQSVIIAEIVDFSREPFSYDEKEEVREYRVNISVDVSYQDLPEEEVVWEDRLEEWGTYFAATETEEDAIAEAASKFAEEVIRRTIEQW